jgi:hypothetical protein
MIFSIVIHYFLFCFHLHSWPRQAEQWIYRHRPGQWPPEILIDNIVNYGCILVPIGPNEIENSELLWRISFSMKEISINTFQLQNCLSWPGM